MTFTTHPVTPSRFDDFADVINPNRRVSHCWCLSHRLNAKEIRELGGDSREEAARALSRRRPPAGVVTYDDDDGVAVGWCSITPRSANPRLTASKLIRPLDELDVWSIICVVVRSGHRKRGVTTELINGAVEYAFAHHAPAVEVYPVDAKGGTIDTTMAFVGTTAMFEKAGFEIVGATDAKASSRPRVVMRRYP